MCPFVFSPEVEYTLSLTDRVGRLASLWHDGPSAAGSRARLVKRDVPEHGNRSLRQRLARYREELLVPRLRKPVLERLMRCYQFLQGLTATEQVQTVTSAQIADALDIDPTQVRKDFGAIGLQGMGRVGFDVCEICRAIRIVFGFDERHEAILIGAGHLGSALLAYAGFARYGLHIVAAFDNDQKKIGTTIAGCTIKSTMLMKSYVEQNHIALAILATPVEASQELADRLTSAGVKAIWNFTPIRLVVPDGVLIRDEHISTGLSEITYHLRE